jgi:hypothetical protein
MIRKIPLARPPPITWTVIAGLLFPVDLRTGFEEVST